MSDEAGGRRQAFEQLSPNRRPQQRLPQVVGALPSTPLAQRRNIDARRPHSSGSEMGTAGSPKRPAWEADGFKLTEQIQEMLVSLHGRVAGLEKGLGGEEKSVGEMKERLQMMEMEHAAMRAEQKTFCTSERLLHLERDVSQKLHRCVCAVSKECT